MRTRNTTAKSVELLNSVSSVNTATPGLSRPRLHNLTRKPFVPESDDVFDVPESSPERQRPLNSKKNPKSAPATPRRSTRTTNVGPTTRSATTRSTEMSFGSASKSSKVHLFSDVSNSDSEESDQGSAGVADEDESSTPGLLDLNISNGDSGLEPETGSGEGDNAPNEVAHTNGLAQENGDETGYHPAAQGDTDEARAENQLHQTLNNNELMEKPDSSPPTHHPRKRKLSDMIDEARAAEPEEHQTTENDLEEKEETPGESTSESEEESEEEPESESHAEPQKRARTESHEQQAAYVEVTSTQHRPPQPTTNQPNDDPANGRRGSPSSDSDEDEQDQHPAPAVDNQPNGDQSQRPEASSSVDPDEDQEGHGADPSWHSREQSVIAKSALESDDDDDDDDAESARTISWSQKAQSLGGQKDNWDNLMKHSNILKKRADPSLSERFNTACTLISRLHDTYKDMRGNLTEGFEISRRSFKGCVNLQSAISTETSSILDKIWWHSKQGQEDRAHDLLFGLQTTVMPAMVHLILCCFLSYYVGDGRFPKSHLYKTMTLLSSCCERVSNQVKSGEVKSRMLSRKLSLSLRKLLEALDKGLLNLRPAVPSRINRNARPFEQHIENDSSSDMEVSLVQKEWTDDEGKTLVEGLKQYQGMNEYPLSSLPLAQTTRILRISQAPTAISKSSATSAPVFKTGQSKNYKPRRGKCVTISCPRQRHSSRRRRDDDG